MRKTCLALICFTLFAARLSTAEVLIIADEFPAMQVLADKLKAEENIASQIVWQTNLPPALSPFQAVVVYIHKALNEPTENALISYTREGGRLVVLHHSISSGKRKNKQWFSFLGVELPLKDVEAGGYKWTEGVTLQIVNLEPKHFITSNKVQYPEQFSWQPPGSPEAKKLPGFTLHDSEVYLNHVLTEPRTVLFGLQYTDAKSGKTYQQAHAGWLKTSGQGSIVYLLPGHSIADFKDPCYGRIAVNAIIWKN